MSTIINTKQLTFDEVLSGGLPAFLNISQGGQYVARFYFNMRGYVQDFQLRNAEGTGFDLGERGKSTQIRELKRAIRDGFSKLIPYEG